MSDWQPFRMPDSYYDQPEPPDYPTACNAAVRSGGKCRLDKGHRGYHATVVYGCDSCDKMFRGRPYVTAPDGEYPNGLSFCFLCARRWT